MDTDSGQGSAWASANDAERRATEALALVERLGQIVFDFIAEGQEWLDDKDMDFLRDLSVRHQRREKDRIAHEKRMADYRQSEQPIQAARNVAGVNCGIGYGGNLFNDPYRNRP
jgi:hypothetical protein